MSLPYGLALDGNRQNLYISDTVNARIYRLNLISKELTPVIRDPAATRVRRITIVPEVGSFDCNSNAVPDECDLASGTEQDCDQNEVPDSCQPDCNGNGIADPCDISSGFSLDIIENGIPDECDRDCNSNGVEDTQDIFDGYSEDCNTNGVPDECDLTSGAEQDCDQNEVPDSCQPDCNSNGIADPCDISSGFSLDLIENGIPDECDLDCNSNGVEDTQDIAEGSSYDCDGDGVPDECQGLWPDCNNNQVPDACELLWGDAEDVNGNGVPDECEPDCNANGVPDDLDIETGTSLDANTNNTPDECEPDCNSNGVLDDIDVTDGVSSDCNENGIPDECELRPSQPPRIYWISSTEGTIRRARLDGSEVEDVLAGLSSGLYAVAVDAASQRVFWSAVGTMDHRGVWRTDLPTGRQVKLSQQPAYSLAFDGGNYAYWTVENGLYRGATNGQQGTLLLSTVDFDGKKFGTIALDVAGGKVYWPDRNGHTVWRANLDGNGPEVIVDQQTKLYAAIAVDPLGGFVYWVDQPVPNQPLIRRATLDGQNIEDVADTTGWPSGLALDETGQMLFVADGENDIISQMDLNEGMLSPVVPDAGTYIRRIATSAQVTATDCNSNNVPDECDIDSGFSLDVDQNGIPDECQPE